MVKFFKFLILIILSATIIIAFCSCCDSWQETYYTYEGVTIKRIDRDALTYFHYVDPNNPNEDSAYVCFKHSGLGGWFEADLIFNKDKSVEIVVLEGLVEESINEADISNAINRRFVPLGEKVIIKKDSMFRMREALFLEYPIDSPRHNVCYVCPATSCPVENSNNKKYQSEVLIVCKGGRHFLKRIKPFKIQYADSIVSKI